MPDGARGYCLQAARPAVSGRTVETLTEDQEPRPSGDEPGRRMGASIRGRVIWKRAALGFGSASALAFCQHTLLPNLHPKARQTLVLPFTCQARSHATHLFLRFKTIRTVVRYGPQKASSTIRMPQQYQIGSAAILLPLICMYRLEGRRMLIWTDSRFG